MSVLSWLKPATLALIVVAGSVLAPASVQAQVTVLRGSPSQPLQPSVQDNTQDNQSSNYSPSIYGDDYPYYGDDFTWGVGGVGRGFHRNGSFDRGFHRNGSFDRGFHAGGFHGRAFHAGGFHGGGFHGGGFHGGGGHR
jgi:hypothetical protein